MICKDDICYSIEYETVKEDMRWWKTICKDNICYSIEYATVKEDMRWWKTICGKKNAAEEKMQPDKVVYVTPSLLVGWKSGIR